MPLGRYNMSDTPPQNDSVDSEIVEQQVETNDSVLESDTSSQVQAESTEQVDDVAVAQEKANAAFNKQYGEKKQLERDLAAQREETAKYQQAERDRQAAAVGNLPAFPDEFDDNFEEKKAAYLTALQAQANFNATNNAYEQQQQANQQQAAQVAQAKAHESMASYSQKATELGIKPEELQAAGNAVMQYNLSNDLTMHILGDPDGPLITKHLAANPQDGYQLATMSPYSVGQFLDGIKVKASALKPKTSSAPAPATNLSGNGVAIDPNKGFVGGATYE